ncbi:hypothetical protein M8C21_022925 [Ambrosia artemisiifolia]|uniref:Allantoate deiminase n=1 Tax=Ambrosia artemisiifolia TaxID=4212 RepID=A0AAD5D119_AMBAR|nr:hypothetical protein M8C21_022925 [Ambrosia artemisiifolia]
MASINNLSIPFFIFVSLFPIVNLLLLSPLLTAASSIISDGLKIDLFPEILRDEAVARLYQLGKVSDADGYLERTFLSPASVRAGTLIRTWMEDAGLTTWVDGLGNVHGRIQPPNASKKTLLIGSHLDTVVDAGMFDGALGIITAISAIKVLNVTGRLKHLRHPVEVIAFSDEEGVRFQSTFLGSAAIAGVLPVATLQIPDKSGLTVQNVLKENLIETTEENLNLLKYEPESVLGYIEVTVKGSQGHAGTVPMSMRQDPMVAAAELIVTFTVDIRTIDDTGREAIIYELSNQMHSICDRRSVSCLMERKHDADAVKCDSELNSQLKSAAYSAVKRMTGEDIGDVPVLMSGAGHDAMAMSHLTNVGMLFVRCRGGISHSPEEHVLDDDVWVAGLAIQAFLETNL